MVQQIQCPVVLCHPEAKVPTRGSESAAGHDLYCVSGIEGIATHDYPDEWVIDWLRFSVQGMITLQPNESCVFRTGIRMAIDDNYVGLLWDRSGLGVVQKVHRTGGVLDADYRGEILVGVTNLSQEARTFEPGDKIVQVIFQERAEAEFPVVDVLPATVRGEDGFASTDEVEEDSTGESYELPPPVEVVPVEVPPEVVRAGFQAPEELDLDNDELGEDLSLEFDDDEIEQADIEALYNAADPPADELTITMLEPEQGFPSEALPPTAEVEMAADTHVVTSVEKTIEYDGRYVSHALSNLRDKQQSAAAEWIRRDEEFFPGGAPTIKVGTLRPVQGRMAIELIVVEITREEIPSTSTSGG